MTSTPSPTPTPTPYYHYVNTPCNSQILYGTEQPQLRLLDGKNAWQGNDNVRWTPDGSQILFTFGNDGFLEGDAGIYAVDADGSRLQTIVDPAVNTVRADNGQMTYFDISPDGSQIVYSTCRYPDSDRLPPSELESWEFSYEIVVSNIDGTNTRRITNNNHFDNFPVWSPDGSQIAFVSDIDPSHNAPETHGRLMVYTMATGELRDITPFYGRDPVAPHPPVWSPDGRHIAVLAYDRDVVFDSEDGNWDWVVEPLAVYTARAGPGDRRYGNKISRAFSEPSWSPDGSRIALVAPWADGAALFTFAPGGSDPVFITSIADRDYDWKWLNRWLNRVYWSPDGSQIMFTGTGYGQYDYYDPYDFESWDSSFVESWGPPYTPEDKRCRGICVASADGAFVTAVSGLRFPSARDGSGGNYTYPLLPDRLSWSPDGSKIAVLSRGRPGSGDAILYTMDPDGNDVRVLVRSDEDRGLIDWKSGTVDLNSCFNGVVVPDPEENSGLVEDCRTLLSVMDTLGGSVSLELSLRWRTDRPIAEWRGVGVGGDLPRVRSLVLHGIYVHHEHGPRSELFGRIPPDLGNLTELRELDLGVNELTGPIPPELGKLANLEVLSLVGNYLRGSIPPELGNLTNLRELRLAHNQLTGDIPPELGSLPNLEVLRLSDNDLGGSIPPELGNLSNLKILTLEFNDLGGSIPAELGNLANLEVLRLGFNGLGGSIPAELGNLTNLRELSLYANQLTGSIPAELGNLPNLEKVSLGGRGNRFTGCVPRSLVDKITDFDGLGLPPCEEASNGR